MNPSSATLKDVARVARVHFTTVSLALRGSPSIPEKTLNRIRRAAERLNYTPNPVFAALTRSRLGRREWRAPPRIAYLVNRSREMGFYRLDHHRQLLKGARSQAKALGYDLELLFVAEDHHDSESLSAYLQSKQIIGLVIAAFEPGLALLVLDWTHYAVVIIDSQHMPSTGILVSSDQLQIVRLAFRQMRAHGYRRVGLAVSLADEDGTNHRYTEGYLIEQAMLPAAERVPALLFPYDADETALSSLLGRWVRRHHIDAILCNRGDLNALLATAGARGRVGVAFACLRLPDGSSQLAGVEANLRTVGVKAVSLLAAQLKSNHRGIPAFASTTYVQGHWKDGASAPRHHQRHA